MGGRDSNSTWVISLFPMPKSPLLQSSHVEFLVSATTLEPSPTSERQQGHLSPVANIVLLLYVWPDGQYCRRGTNATYSLEKDIQPSMGGGSTEPETHKFIYSGTSGFSITFPPIQGFSNSVFGARLILCWGGCLVHCRTLSSIPALYPIDASSNPTHPRLWQSKIPLDTVIISGLGGCKTAHVENHRLVLVCQNTLLLG